MSVSEATTPSTAEPPAAAVPFDERDLEPRTPMKRLGSTRKLAAFNKNVSGRGQAYNTTLNLPESYKFCLIFLLVLCLHFKSYVLSV
ncbi:unnamed protein product [Pieris macdunnoughi]|uniref:Uncharacterized protein n=1 Tax=Pieris macdunnoughi TaxID=345717 RepID=A0A821SHS1_9NEOP|nr:unnamed protein product [Pieris macdunnoughi]